MDGSWTVGARLERFSEPVILATLRRGRAHGYELADSLRPWIPEDRIDLGNLYRMLRSMEDDGIVRSHWSQDDPGRAKRMYELTDDGEQLLDAWLDSLRAAGDTIGAFLRECGEGKEGTE
jgi:DNA-binding PadR family transcriptional regulator